MVPGGFLVHFGLGCGAGGWSVEVFRAGQFGSRWIGELDCDIVGMEDAARSARIGVVWGPLVLVVGSFVVCCVVL